ncbi:Ubiquitin carboxyl-terminal hydrolase MINDY-2 [Labeo rohita]|uniref:Ubiquitin carboxyl-terminal hydrolase n=1 Tax=Labeo rohita TaxID=84645 RepID=A0ABQ8MIF9_LABRO|nr:Ubiquitin carboxyl-terminal hydrolase MINDY-2 [Labeo rohita]
MEKNGNPHRDAGGSVLCTAIPAEPADIKTVGGMKDVCEKRETLSTCASASGANATPCTQTSDAAETVSKSGQPSALPETLSPDPTDQLSNGMGYEPSATAAGNKEGGTSKLVNNLTGDQPDINTGQADGLDGATQEATKLAKSAFLSSDKAKSASSNSNDHTVSEGPPSGSEPSIAGESRSFDSLESFSNLNSCPSSDLNSEGLEDKGLALAVQGEYGAEGTKIPCSKDRVTGQSLYHIKWIKWKEENTPIITQNENGPCPLLAIMNVLLLSWKVKLPPMMEIITAEQLMEYLGDYILEAKPKEISEAQRLNYEQSERGAHTHTKVRKNLTGPVCSLRIDLGVFSLCKQCTITSLSHLCEYRWTGASIIELAKMGQGSGVVQKRWQGHRDRAGPHAGWAWVGVGTGARLNGTEWELWVDGSWLICQTSNAHRPRCQFYMLSSTHWPSGQPNMSDAMAVLHKLQTGLDVNVKFTGVRVFEYTPECIVFDLLDIPLYHGWLVDPQMADIVKAVGNCSYNQLVEKIISCKQSDNSELAGEEQFLNSTATQLTYHGLCELTSTVQEGELCVFFRNNHFSTMTKFKAQLYLLVTDQGFLTEEKVVWESLHNVDGDGNFCDSEFHLRPPSDPETVYRGQQDQIDQDYLMALSLQQEQQASDLGWEQIPEGISDLELAKKLQEEEDRRASQYYQEQEQAQAAAAAAAQAQIDRQPLEPQPGEPRLLQAQENSPQQENANPRRKPRTKTNASCCNSSGLYVECETGSILIPVALQCICQREVEKQ